MSRDFKVKCKITPRSDTWMVKSGPDYVKCNKKLLRVVDDGNGLIVTRYPWAGGASAPRFRLGYDDAEYLRVVFNKMHKREKKRLDGNK